ncbi:hypothetical protein KIN20_032472 [Parelaphostrongylus tenuis]|uniref:Uncharacterized protein n=1 Tax=Parelaphostrongylus tenuis TaxID=148309 RepID=A0AAD5WI34_PARTN|nr:hypothetical protein KIN20_032472 [Parelaphostrongylus tenuis]
MSCQGQPRPSRPVTYNKDALCHELEVHPETNTGDLKHKCGYGSSTIARHLNETGCRKVMSDAHLMDLPIMSTLHT